jgi:hypothetical protein
MTKLTAAQIKRGKNLPHRLISIGKEIEAKASKADTYHAKAADMVVSIKQLLVEAQSYCDKGGLNAFRKLYCPSLGRSRAYELLAIASGKKTIEQSKAEGATRQARHVAKLRAAAAAMRSVSDGKSVDGDLRQFTRSVLELVLLTETTSPAEFAATIVSADDLKKLSAFLQAVADPQTAPIFRRIKANKMRALVEEHHYTHRMNTNEWAAFGAFDGDLAAGALFSPTRFKEPVIALARLVRRPDYKVPMSKFLGWCCNQLRLQGDHLIVAYADSEYHHGGVYQASGFKYGGLRKSSNDGLMIGGVFHPGRSLNRRYKTRSKQKIEEIVFPQNVEAHYDEGKHLYWRALSAAGKTSAKQLGLADLPYPKPTLDNVVRLRSA